MTYNLKETDQPKEIIIPTTKSQWKPMCTVSERTSVVNSVFEKTMTFSYDQS